MGNARNGNGRNGGTQVFSHGMVTLDLSRAYAGWGLVSLDADELWHHKRYETEDGLKDIYSRDTTVMNGNADVTMNVPFAYYDHTLEDVMHAVLRFRENDEPLCLRGALSLYCDGDEDGARMLRVSDRRVRISEPYGNHEGTTVLIRSDGGSYRNDLCSCVADAYDAVMDGDITPAWLWQFVGDDNDDDSVPSTDAHDYNWHGETAKVDYDRADDWYDNEEDEDEYEDD